MDGEKERNDVTFYKKETHTQQQKQQIKLHTRHPLTVFQTDRINLNIFAMNKTKKKNRLY